MSTSAYGIIGWPLTHTFSPGYFNEKFRREGLDAVYTPFPLSAIDRLPALLQAQPGLKGFNVTIPYKTAVMPFLDTLSPDAAELGAVNCVAVRDGRLAGYNTDWQGFLHSLKPLLQPHHRQALILGTGGAAKAVAYALRRLQLPFQIVSRGNYPLAIGYNEVTPALLQEYTLLINTTPLGMSPDEDRAPELPYAALTAQHLLYDLIYMPAETKFLRLGAAQGAATKNGYEMLLQQAEASWAIWNRPA